jgi:phage terminase large subunit-like protein
MAVLDEDPPWSSGSETDVLEEALKKSTVVWVEVPGDGGTGGRAVPVWYGILDGRVYVLVGGSEQHVDGLAEATRVLLVARSKEQQSLVAEVEASARVVDPKDPLYDRVAPVLLPRRLNLRDGEQAVDRWRKECTLVELTPSSIPAEV